jgi:hypothetical protein
MPYAIRKLPNKNQYKVYNKSNGYIHAKHSTLANAQSQMRLLNAIEYRRGGPSATAKAKTKAKSKK